MTIEAIKEAIADLPPEEKVRLAAWVIEQDQEEWDRQIQDDFSPGGRGMALLEEARADAGEGRSKPLDELLAKMRAWLVQLGPVLPKRNRFPTAQSPAGRWILGSATKFSSRMSS